MKLSRPRPKEEQLDLFADIDPPVAVVSAHAIQARPLHSAPGGLCGECLVATGNPFGCTSLHAATANTLPVAE